MLTAIFIVLIVVSICAIGWVIIPKLPRLRSLNVEDMPAERWKRLKTNIMIEKVNRKISGLRKRVLSARRRDALKSGWGALYAKIKKLEARYKVQTKEVKLKVLLRHGFEALRDDPKEAESFFLEAVRIDPKNIAAYEGLLEFYLSGKSFPEAEEIVRFLSKLNPASAGRYCFDLAQALAKAGNTAQARVVANEAIVREPGNPKYLDFLIELAIMGGDARGARQFLKNLRAVNPENAKIDEFERSIAEI